MRLMAALGVALVVASCSSGGGAVAPPPTGSSAGGAGGSPGGSVTIRLVVPDGNVRELGATCAGASGFRYAHPEAPFIVEDPDGEPVATGALPQGRAEKAWSMDMGDDRQPTVCVMLLEVAGLGSAEGHSLVIGDRDPEPIVPNPNLDGMPQVVLS